jgi:1,4-dihydroxy-2-naphthoyl-CoA synthase
VAYVFSTLGRGVYAFQAIATALVATTQDCQEGLDAFVEKRPPNYTGR